MRLYLVRHPRPDVADNVCYGATDVPVTAEAVGAAAAGLAHSLPLRVPVFSSPLCRCRQLAEAIAVRVGAGRIEYDARLREMDFGNWEMCAWDDIARTEIDAWAGDMAVHRPGGAESVLDMACRVQEFMNDLRARQVAGAIVVCHAGTIRLLLAAVHGGSLQEIALQAAQRAHVIGYGSVTVLEC